MRLPEKCFEWQAGAWTFGVTLCPGTWAAIVWTLWAAERPQSPTGNGSRFSLRIISDWFGWRVTSSRSRAIWMACCTSDRFAGRP